AQFGAMAEYVAPGVLHGSVGEIVDRVGAYGEAGADWVILAMRAPFDVDGLDMFATEVLPKLRCRRAVSEDSTPTGRHELRYDALTGEWVAIVGARQN